LYIKSALRQVQGLTIYRLCQVHLDQGDEHHAAQERERSLWTR